MLSDRVIPLVIAVEDHFSVVQGVKFKAFNDFSLDDAVQGFNVGVFLRIGYMSELLAHPFFLKILPDHFRYELATIVISEGHPFDFVFQEQQREHHDHIPFSYVEL